MGYSLALQADVDKLCLWSGTWKLALNPSKCKSITFTLRRKPVDTTYHIGGTALERVSQMRDLGVLLDSKLTFGPHIDELVRKVNRALGMYLRSLQSYRAPAGRRLPPGPIMTGFNAHIRAIMEFGCVIWGGAAKTHIARLERIQHKFLMWLGRHSNSPCASLDYTDLLRHFGVLRIDQRLVLNDLNFVQNVFTGRIDSGDILAMFSLAVPSRTRSKPVLYVPAARVDTIRNGLFCRLPRAVNSLCEKRPTADLFGSRAAFRSQVKAFVSSL